MCRDFTDVNICRIFCSTSEHLRTGTVNAITRVMGCSLHEKRSGKFLERHEFTLPAMEIEGNAVWIELPSQLLAELTASGCNWRGATHGINHLLLSVIPLFVRCDMNDINSEHINVHEERPRYVQKPVNALNSLFLGLFECLCLKLNKGELVLFPRL
jgi:ATP-dependent helicase YprA (DUF1998 family)